MRYTLVAFAKTLHSTRNLHSSTDEYYRLNDGCEHLPDEASLYTVVGRKPIEAAITLSMI